MNLVNNPTGEILLLKNPAGNTVDTANINNREWPAGSASPNYESMERCNPHQPDTDANWNTNNGTIKNGLDADGNPINGTPRQGNSCYSE